MKDCRGHKLDVGDTVVYPHAQGSSGASLWIATVVELVEERTENRYGFEETVPTKVRVQRAFNSRGTRIYTDRTSLVTPEFTLRVVLP